MKLPKISRIIFCLTMLIAVQLPAFGQQPTVKFSKKEMAAAIDSINVKLRQNYIFPEVADKMAQGLVANVKTSRYEAGLDNPSAFAKLLTEDLYAISKDKHLRVIFDPSIISRERALTAVDRAKEESEWMQELVQHLKRDNFGFRELKIMDGNIGYLDLREFSDPKYAGETLVSAMNYLSNTEAIILDLRKNDGGSPAMVQLLASYFFAAEPVHLSDHYNRPRNEHSQSWTLPFVPGKRMADTPLYLLTSSKTFSAAEGFSYQLKCLERVTIIGETTAGGAHLTGSVIASDQFFVRIPQGRVTSPITNSNWEGTGVKPDIEVNAADALEIAHAKAVERLKGEK